LNSLAEPLQQYNAKAAQGTMLKRPGRAEEVAAAILFLASDDDAKDECRRRGIRRMELSTSELQPEAAALYRRAGYRLVREVVAEKASNKTMGGGIRRLHFDKD
jgi:hypothetical protein